MNQKPLSMCHDKSENLRGEEEEVGVDEVMVCVDVRGVVCGGWLMVWLVPFKSQWF